MASTSTVSTPADGGEAPPLHKHPYHLVDPSPWPLVGAFAGGALVLGIILVAHYGSWWMLILGVLGEYVGRAFLSANGKPQGVIREVRGPAARRDDPAA